jgi:hypothetical protein
MRFLALAIALFALCAVAYMSFEAPSQAAVFNSETSAAAAAPAPSAA